MSNGIGPNPLNPLSKIYLEQVAKKKKDDTYLEPDMKKRQDNNEKARKDLMKGPQMKNPHFEQKQQGWESVNALADAYKAMQEGIRDEDPEKGTAERKARLEKKRGMKLDDHPQYKKEEVDPEKSKKIRKKLPHMGTGNPYYDAKSAGSSRVKGFKFTPVKEESEEVEQIDEIIDPKGAARIDDAKKKKKVDVFAYDRKLQAQGKLKGKKLPPPPTNESLDPVGQEDKDIDNDGDHDKTDKYLYKRRKAIGKAIKKRMSEQEEKIGGGNLKKLAGKATKRIDADNDGDVDEDDPKEKGMGEFVPSPDGKKKVRTSVKFESYSWRQDLSEIMTDDIDSKPIKEKKVNNKIKINPKLGEAVEEMGGTLIEMVEIDEFDYIIESVYDELAQEGYEEDDIEDAIEYALVEVSDRYYDSAVKASKQAAAKKNREELKKKAVGRLRYMKRKAGEAVSSAKKKVGMASAKAQVAAYNKGREVAQTAGDKVRRAKKAVSDAPQKAKSGIKAKIKKAAQKVVDRMSEEVVDETYTVTAADKKGNTPAYQAYKAGKKKKDGTPMYKVADHMKEGDAVENVDEGIVDTLKGAAKGAKKGVEKARKFQQAPYKAVDRMQRMTRHKQDKYGPSTLKQRVMTGADHNIDNERKAKMKTEEASMSPQEVQLQKKKAMIDKMIANKRMQGLKKSASAEPAKAMGEALSVDDQMRISREYNRMSPEQKKAANKKALGTIKRVKREKDTRTDAQKMTDATGPRPGSRYRGD